MANLKNDFDDFFDWSDKENQSEDLDKTKNKGEKGLNKKPIENYNEKLIYNLEELKELKDLVDIVSLISGYYGIPLKKSNKEYIGLCPFHDDHKPSLSVNREKGLWHCFGCGRGGTSIDFVKYKEGVCFQKAVDIIRERISKGLVNTKDKGIGKDKTNPPDNASYREEGQKSGVTHQITTNNYSSVSLPQPQQNSKKKS